MKIIRHILFLFFVFISTKIVAQQPATPIELNNRLVSVTDTLYLKGGAWGKQLLSSDSTGNYYLLTPYRMAMENYVEEKIKEVNAIKDISGSEKLRKAIISFLEYERKLIANAFVPFEKADAFTPQWKMDELNDALSKFAEKEDVELGKVHTAQKEYASKNNFEIETGAEK